MSQNDFNLANQGFPSMRADMNSAFQALASNSSGATAPSTTYPYQWWYDTSTDTIKMRNADNNGWISVAVVDQVNSAWLIVDKTSLTGSALLPAGTTAQRDGSPEAGYIRFNTEEGFFEGYDGSVWAEIGGGGGGATGVPAGSVIWYAANTAPTGYLKANGAAVSRTTYADLFTAIGTTFGAGDGSTTFNVPDLRGEFVRGWDDARGIDTGRVFGSAQSDDNKSHTHTGSAATAGAHSHTVQTIFVGAVAETQAMNAAGSVGLQSTSTAGSHSHTLTIDTSGTEARPRNIALLACIKF